MKFSLVAVRTATLIISRTLKYIIYQVIKRYENFLFPPPTLPTSQNAVPVTEPNPNFC